MDIEKIARRIVAGGGSGIKFQTVDVDCNLKILAKGSIDSCQFIPSGSLKINEFNALGYQDGMTNVDGQKIFGEINCSYVFDDAIQAIKENIFNYNKDDEDFIAGLEQGIKFEIYPDGNGQLMYSPGYVRSKIEQGDKIQFEFYFEACCDYGRCCFNTIVPATVTEEGGYWYEDVFEQYEPEDYIISQYRR